MSATAILVVTVLLVLVVLAVALLTGSLALLVSRRGDSDTRRGGLAHALRLLDRQWRIERLVYKHHRFFGLLVLAASVFCIWQMTRAELTGLVNGSSAASLLLWMLLLALAFNLLVGLIILFRPSLLKPLEAFANRWHHLDAADESRPGGLRLTATLLALVGLAVLLGSATLLFEQITAIFG